MVCQFIILFAVATNQIQRFGLHAYKAYDLKDINGVLWILAFKNFLFYISATFFQY